MTLDQVYTVIIIIGLRSWLIDLYAYAVIADMHCMQTLTDPNGVPILTPE